jgi:hypothetical protein
MRDRRLAGHPAFQRAARFGRRFQPAARHEPDPGAGERRRLCRTMAHAGCQCEDAGARLLEVPVATPPKPIASCNALASGSARGMPLRSSVISLVFCAPDLASARDSGALQFHVTYKMCLYSGATRPEARKEMAPQPLEKIESATGNGARSSPETAMSSKNEVETVTSPIRSSGSPS